MTSLGICKLVADYHVAHQQWPLTRTQLDEQLGRWLEEEKAQMSAEEIHNLVTFLDRFTLLDLRQTGHNLLFHYRFDIDQKTVDQTLMFKPKPTSDEILRSVTVK